MCRGWENNDYNTAAVCTRLVFCPPGYVYKCIGNTHMSVTQRKSHNMHTHVNAKLVSQNDNLDIFTNVERISRCFYCFVIIYIFFVMRLFDQDNIATLVTDIRKGKYAK